MNTPELRISDEERERAVSALGDHYAAGRLTKDEYDERATSAYAARTSSALRPLFVDLPGPHPFAGALRAGVTPGLGRTRPSGPGSWSTGPFGGPPPGWEARPPAGARPGFRLPFLPFLLVLIGLAILFGAPWLVFIGLGAMFFARAHRKSAGWGGCGSTSRSHGGR